MDFFDSFIAILNGMSPFVLLGFFVAGLLHAFVAPSAMSRHLSGHGWKPVVKAALFGIPLPLCSCGVLPAAVALRRQGASKSASVSFLIATPQTGVDSIAATYSLLGIGFAIIRPVAALVGAVAGGLSVGRWAPGEDDPVILKTVADSRKPLTGVRGFVSAMGSALRYGMVDMVSSVGKWLVIGLVVAAAITVFVPDSLFVGLSRYPLLAMLAMVAVSVPMYVCATGSIPIALSLMMKGLSPGVAFVLLMAGPAANFASVMVLSRTHGKRATAIYVASVALTAMAFGLMIDFLLPGAWFVPSVAAGPACCDSGASLVEIVSSVVLVALLIYSFLISRLIRHRDTSIKSVEMEREYKIKGMACAHCKAAVERAIIALPGVESVTVDLRSASAVVSGNVDPDEVINAISGAGYEYVPD